MYVIEISERRGDHVYRHIAGIFSDVVKRHAVASAIPPDQMAHMSLVQTNCQSYPVYIIEQASGFQYGDREAALGFLERTKASLSAEGAPALEDDEPLFNLYRIGDDFEPRTVGVDEMGRLSHRHVMRDELLHGNLSDLLGSH